MGDFKYIILFVCAMITSCLTFGQRYVPKRPPTGAEGQAALLNHICVHQNKYSVGERSGFYPFKSARIVKLVSFYGKRAIENSLPLVNGTVNYAALNEVKTLTRLQINALTDILYNVGDKAPNWIRDPGASCYNPHNAILFVDKNGRTFAYIEICFACSKYRLSTKKIKIGEFCSGKYDLLKNYFDISGIKIGVTRNTN